MRPKCGFGKLKKDRKIIAIDILLSMFKVAFYNFLNFLQLFKSLPMCK